MIHLVIDQDGRLSNFCRHQEDENNLLLNLFMCLWCMHAASDRGTGNIMRIILQFCFLNPAFCEVLGADYREGKSWRR